MKVINRFRLCDFWTSHARAEIPLRAWFQLVSSFDWQSPESLAATFPSAQFHEGLTAFDIQGSTYFLIATIDYTTATAWVRDVQVHKDFAAGDWKALASTDTGEGRSYRDLIDKFPLRPITDEDQLKQAAARIEALLTRSDRTADEQDYFNVLSLLVREYEHQQPDMLPVSGAEIVRSLVNEHRLTMIDLIPLLGNKQKALALLQGTRALDLRQGTRLSRYFKLPAETFMDPDDLEIEIPKAPRGGA